MCQLAIAAVAATTAAWIAICCTLLPTAFESPIGAFVAAVTATDGAPDVIPVTPLSISLSDPT